MLGTSFWYGQDSLWRRDIQEYLYFKIELSTMLKTPENYIFFLIHFWLEKNYLLIKILKLVDLKTTPLQNVSLYKNDFRASQEIFNKLVGWCHQLKAGNHGCNDSL